MRFHGVDKKLRKIFMTTTLIEVIVMIVIQILICNIQIHRFTDPSSENSGLNRNLFLVVYSSRGAN